MSDPHNPNRDTRSTPQYALYQRSNFWKSNEGETPLFNTDPKALESLAKAKLSENGWLYASSNAGQSSTHLTNRQSFYRHRIIPRMGVDTNTRDTRTSLFGHSVPAPIGFAPVGINSIYHPSAELGVARAAGELGLPYCLSTAGSSSIESVAAANDEGAQRYSDTFDTTNQPTSTNTTPSPNPSNPKKGLRFFQLYMPHDDRLTRSLLQRAHNSGFTACILTLDTWQLGWRHDDIATSNYAFYHGKGADLGLSDPVFLSKLQAQNIDPTTHPNEAGAAWIDSIWHGRAHTWPKIRWARDLWKQLAGADAPFCVKGVQSVEDARLALEARCDGIVVSNHAGRQVDGAVSSLDALEDIVESGIGADLTVMYDSGVRSASDVFKAVALGAGFVFVGRLWIWGLSIMGETGVLHVMRSLLAELDILMNVAGYAKIEDIKRNALESGPRDYRLTAPASKL